MADSTTSNAKRSIATKGTRHLAYAIHPDYCFPKGKKVPKPYDNYVESTQLKKGQTVTALVDEQPVWTSVGELGPDSEPHHAGVDKGLNSKTYCAEAKALSYSKDVKFEGNGAVRLDDLTTQNHANTVGRVLERPLDVELSKFLAMLAAAKDKPWSKDVTIIRRGNVWVIVDKENHVMVLLGTQEFHGAGATQAYADKVSQRINDTWSGTMKLDGEDYQVKSLITGSVRADGDPPITGANQIDVISNGKSVYENSNHDPANQTFYGTGAGGHQHDTDTDDGLTITAHEFGHSMGLDDEYHDRKDAAGNLVKDPNGNRICDRDPDSPKGSLMGYVESDSKPRNDNYNSLVTGNKLKPGNPPTWP